MDYAKRMTMSIAINRTYQSPNHGPRSRPILGVVLHSGGGTRIGDLGWLTSPASGVSSHFYVDRIGMTYQLVNDDQVAWHAGRGRWMMEIDLNSVTIGIEMEHTANVHHDYPPAQLQALAALCRDKIAAYDIPPSWIVAHRWCAVPLNRKPDPVDWSDHQMTAWIRDLYTPTASCFKNYHVRSDGTRIRTLPSVSSQIMATLRSGSAVRGVEVAGLPYQNDTRWVYLSITGYVHRSLLEELPGTVVA